MWRRDEFVRVGHVMFRCQMRPVSDRRGGGTMGEGSEREE